MTPFVCLPGPLGPIAWSLLSIGLLGWAMHVLVRDILPGHWSTQREAWFLILTLLASAVGIWSLQSNALVTALVALGLAAALRHQWWKASLLLAIPVFIKLWPMALVLLLIVYWPRQLLGRFAAVCLALVLFPYLTRPPRIVEWQYRELVHLPHRSIAGALARLPGCVDHLGGVLPLHRTCVGSARLSLCLHGTESHDGRQRPRLVFVAGGRLAGKVAENEDNRGYLLMLILSMWSAWQLLFGPGTEQLTYGLIAPAASWAVLVSIAERRAVWLTCTAWAMLTLLPSGDIERSLLDIIPAARGLLPLGVVLFIAWLLWHERGAASCPTFATDEQAASSLA